MIRDSLYHKCLRVSAVLCACVLVFQSGYIGTEELSRTTTRYMANTIGMFASVQENELNVITAELTKQQTALDERERALREREIDAQARDTSGDYSVSDFVMSGMLLLLLLLIVMNYLFDFMRARARLRTYANAT